MSKFLFSIQLKCIVIYTVKLQKVYKSIINVKYMTDTLYSKSSYNKQ